MSEQDLKDLQWSTSFDGFNVTITLTHLPSGAYARGSVRADEKYNLRNMLLGELKKVLDSHKSAVVE